MGKQKGVRVSITIFDERIIELLDSVPRVSEKTVLLRDLLMHGVEAREGYWRKLYNCKHKEGPMDSEETKTTTKEKSIDDRIVDPMSGMDFTTGE